MNGPRLGAVIALALAAACRSPAAPSARTVGPYLVALGTAQDGGLPHASCGCERCEHARSDPEGHARLVAGLALCLASPDGGTWLVDATPDLPEQLERVRALRPRPRAGVDRAPIDGVLLTHAHVGHYLGLAWLGFEAVHVAELPVRSSPRMAEFLRANGPWSQMVALGEIALEPFELDVPFRLGSVRVTAFGVPHRDEYSDTVAFRFEGPRRTVLYVPDTDGWELWDPPLAERLAGVDVALVDGSFYSLDELPGRSLEEVRHPLIGETMDRLQPRVDGGLDVRFTHLNHTNRALGPDPDAHREIEARGFRILAEGARIPL